MSFRPPAVRGALLRLSIALAIAVATLLSSGLAAAQIAVLQETSLPRLDKERNPTNKRDQRLTPEAVNLQDCIDDQYIRFPLQLSGFQANAQIRVFASNDNDCKEQTARAGGTAVCWELGNVPLQTQVNADFPVRAIMSGRLQAQQPDASAAICGKVDLSTIQVNFLYFAPGTDGGSATFVKTVKISVDTVGPEPPTGLSVLPGNTRLQVTWVNISGGDPDASTTGGTTGGLTALTGIKIYCDPSAGGGGAPANTADASCVDVPNEAGADGGDAGTTQVCTEAESDAGRIDTADGSAPSFVDSTGAPRLPDAEFNRAYECGSLTGNAGTSITATGVGGQPLENGRRYAVAVAATDAFGNVGKLSSVICETPEETTDFRQDYRRAGGEGGGCAAGGELPLGSLAPLATVGALFLTALRARSRRRNGR